MSVSVVIPAKDDAQRLRVCLEALNRQTVVPFEVIIVDNGSTDTTAAVARAAGARVIFEGRPGIPAASSTGYDAATGDVIARLDADSIPSAEWVEGIARRFVRHPNVDAFTGGAVFSGGPERLRRIGAGLYLGAYYSSLALALGHVPLFGSNFAMRRAAWEAVRWTVHRADTELHDDLDLSFHLGAPFRVRFARGMVVQISHRPMIDAASFRKRVRRGFHTVFAHWPQELPWLRWYRFWRAAASASHRTEPAATPTIWSHDD